MLIDGFLPARAVSLLFRVRVFRVRAFRIRLHPFRQFFLQGQIPQPADQPNHFSVRIHRLFQGILHPEIRLAADIYKNIARGHLHDILRRRLETVRVHPVIQQQRHIRFRRLLAQNIHNPVVFRKNGGHNGETPVIRTVFRASRTDGSGTASRQTAGHYYDHYPCRHDTPHRLL